MYILSAVGGTYRASAGVCQGPESKSGDFQGAPDVWTRAERIDVYLCLDLQVSLRLWISPGRLWKHSFSPFASQHTINANDLQNGLLPSSKGVCPKSRPLEQSVSPTAAALPLVFGSLFTGSGAQAHCRRRPCSRLHRDESVATIEIRAPDNAVHGKNCLVPQPKLRRSLLDRKSLHRHCWLGIGRRPPHAPSQEAPHTVQ